MLALVHLTLMLSHRHRMILGRRHRMILSRCPRLLMSQALVVKVLAQFPGPAPLNLRQTQIEMVKQKETAPQLPMLQDHLETVEERARLKK